MTRAALIDLLTRTLDDDLQRRGAALVVGVTGADASGKSQFAHVLARHLLDRGTRCQLVHVDDFHRPRSVRYAGDLPEPEKYLTQSIDLEQLATDILIPIREQGHLRRTIQHLNIDRDDYSQERVYDVDARTVVIVEGVFLLRPPIANLLDRIVFLDVTDEELLRRGTRRDQTVHGADTERKFREKFLPAQRRVFAAYPPAENAQVIIDNNDWEKPAVRRWELS